MAVAARRRAIGPRIAFPSARDGIPSLAFVDERLEDALAFSRHGTEVALVSKRWEAGVEEASCFLDPAGRSEARTEAHTCFG
ncbi:MAG TPA: hypothetical protein VD833_02780, partial [Vicinamibacterales bacterium]|nr:hypothetical protein [Vicinamibacterales bacterium]